MDEMQWPDSPPQPGDSVELKSATITRCSAIGIQMISGDIARFEGSLDRKIQSLGLCELVESNEYLVRTARDQALWVTLDPQDFHQGWNESGYAVTACDDAWVQFLIAGEGAEHVVRQGISSDISHASPSAAILFAGQKACIIKDKKGFLVFIESPMQTYVWSWFKAAE